MEYRLVTDFTRPPMSSNDQKRAHYHTVAKCKKQVGEKVKELAADIPPIDRGIVKVIWYAKDKRRRDNDSLGPFLKAAKDGLVDAGVFTDDHSEIVIEDRLAVRLDRENPRIEVVITEVGNDREDQAQ